MDIFDRHLQLVGEKLREYEKALIPLQNETYRRFHRILFGDGTMPDIRGVYRSAEVKAVNRPSVCTVTRKGVKSPLFQD